METSEHGPSRLRRHCVEAIVAINARCGTLESTQEPVPKGGVVLITNRPGRG